MYNQLVKEVLDELQSKKVGFRIKYEEERTIVGVRLSFQKLNFSLETNIMFSNKQIDVINKTNHITDPNQKQEYITMLGKVTALNTEPHMLKWLISKTHEVISTHTILMTSTVDAKEFVNLLLFLCKETASQYTKKIQSKPPVNNTAN